MTAIISYDPFRSFRSLQGEINRLFERDLDESSGIMTQWPLRVDIREDEHHILIKADIPGLEQKDINVNIGNGRLTLTGERKFEDEQHKEQYYRVERAYGRFSRSFQLPNTTDVNAIQAEYKNGVLTVTLPKRAEAKPRTIQVTVH